MAGNLRPADAARHRRRLHAPVRQARPHHPRQDRVRRLRHGDPLPAASLAGRARGVSASRMRALEMLAANRYVRRAGTFSPYHVTWQAGR